LDIQTSFLRRKKAVTSKGLAMKDYMARLRSLRKKSKSVSKTKGAVHRSSSRLQEKKLLSGKKDI